MRHNTEDADILVKAAKFLSSVRLDVPTMDRLGRFESDFGPPPIIPDIAPPFGLELELEHQYISPADASSEDNHSSSDTTPNATTQLLPFSEFSNMIAASGPILRFTLCLKSNHESVFGTPLIRCSFIVGSDDAEGPANDPFSDVITEPVQRALFGMPPPVEDEKEIEGEDTTIIGIGAVSYREWLIGPDAVGPPVLGGIYRPYASRTRYRLGLLDDPEMRLSSTHTTHRMLGLVSSFVPYVDERQRKEELNTQFRLRWRGLPPNLSLSKIRKIRSIIASFSCDNDSELDDSTKLLAYLYFERCVFQNVVNKANRKAIAAACM
eukprot:c24026_g1_i1.p1 GENE.c24026_g1_i1~~c24026_g1_i1.p1  ORF type:complete len:331 (-),score=65.96 c24026_g1_i1:226-1194(-)